MTEQKKSEIRKALQEAAIQTISEYGLDRVTTKELSSRSGLGNEAYIYRVYANKHELLSATFDQLDEELVRAISEALHLMRDESRPVNERTFAVFSQVWRFILNGPDRCNCFMQYYYSPLYVRYSAEKHKKLYEKVTERFGSVFKEGTDVWRMLNYILDILLTMSIKVFRGEVEDTPEFENKVFAWCYRSFQPYLIWSE